jgi:tripartite-type tricarboxylate transporter receptor subunit TctC
VQRDRASIKTSSLENKSTMVQKTLRLLRMVASIQIASALVAAADSLPNFYQGKTITFYIGAEPGGGYDLYARALARHIAHHIAGSPAILPMNMPGAGGTRKG